MAIITEMASQRMVDRGATERRRASWLNRVGWLILIWAASVAALAVVALLFRGAMSLVGLTAG
ncbi:MAG: DUF2474 family protein [Azospirillaceae bacterium]|nr:DUF2474 family protein [Azospirillaceae bacterium]